MGLPPPLPLHQAQGAALLQAVLPLLPVAPLLLRSRRGRTPAAKSPRFSAPLGVERRGGLAQRRHY